MQSQPTNLHRCRYLLSFVSFFLAGLSIGMSPAYAGFWSKVNEEHAVPTFNKGFDTTGLLIVGTGLGLVAVAQPHDYEVREHFSRNQQMSSSASRVGDILGTGIPGAMIALGQIRWDEENGIAHAEALLASLAVTSLLKQTNQRTRPASENRHSMPSGHTSTAFTTATHLSYAYGWTAAVPSFMVASFVAASRWSDDAHWLSDTIAGATIGVFWGRATWFHHHHLSPIVLDDGGGLGLGFTKAY